MSLINDVQNYVTTSLDATQMFDVFVGGLEITLSYDTEQQQRECLTISFCHDILSKQHDAATCGVSIKAKMSCRAHVLRNI